MDSKQLDLAAQMLEQRFDVAAVLLFGSQLHPPPQPWSDVDLAIVLGHGRTLPALELLDAREDLSGLFGKDVDLVVLDQASPILAMQILRDHRVLRCSRRTPLDEIFMRTPSAYFDLKQVRAPIERQLMRAGS